uniref:Putative G-protein coupled receptor 125 n=1 Tax=Lygus hesperus TaxID=30085 RepID=A0A0A9W0Y1_LYGHE
MVLFGLIVAVFLGTTWSMPLEMDLAMQDLAQADMEVMKFYAAWERKDFPLMLELYHRLDEALPKLKADLSKMHKIDFSDSHAQSLKRLLSIQFESTIMKLNGMLPPKKVSIDQSPTKPKSSKSLVPPGTPKVNVDKQKKPTLSPDVTQIRNPQSRYGQKVPRNMQIKS